MLKDISYLMLLNLLGLFYSLTNAFLIAPCLETKIRPNRFILWFSHPLAFALSLFLLAMIPSSSNLLKFLILLLPTLLATAVSQISSRASVIQNSWMAVNLALVGFLTLTPPMESMPEATWIPLFGNYVTLSLYLGVITGACMTILFALSTDTFPVKTAKKMAFKQIEAIRILVGYACSETLLFFAVGHPLLVLLRDSE